ncbi:MAG: 23S rRNA (guanosine(2251)-2'-O)-methyltransferase RlmB [Alphaproteobacteria bacterium]|nr:23S rRNA (guanosine(2251)-2'-O)-methyltransferase RlmB [Alphaproteobacteria bacterium]
MQGNRAQGARPAAPQGDAAGHDNRLRLAARPQEPRPHEPRRAEAPAPRNQTAAPRASRAPDPRADFGHHGGPPDRRGGDAPKGSIWLYGIHAVAAALANPARRLRRLLLSEEAEAAVLAQFPQPWPMQPERTDRARLEHILGRDAVHQGAALMTDPLTPPPLAQVLERPGPVLVLDQVTDPRNVGAILRSAAAFGAAAVITQERNAPDETGALAKAASGAMEKVPLFKAVNISRTLVALKAAGLWCVGLDASGIALSGPGLADRRIALVLGAEGEGLRRLTRETCDVIAGLSVPQGHASAMESLNVSAAAAIALYEIQRKA